MTSIDYVEHLSEEDFINQYVKTSKPFVHSKGAQDWDLAAFAPAALRESLAQETVQVYDDLFELQDLTTLDDYLSRNFDKDKSLAGSRQYVRAYTQFKDFSFAWADGLFEKISHLWKTPEFFPKASLLLPLSDTKSPKSPVMDAFPFKGLFISGRGAKTRLHRDPLHSNAILCQVHGDKEVIMYAPEKYQKLLRNGKLIDIHDRNMAMVLLRKGIEPDFRFTLKQGEIVFFPSGWVHDVTSITDCVSLTWNFVERCQRQEFCQWLQENPNDEDLDVISYLLNKENVDVNDAEQMQAFYRREGVE